MWSRIHRAILKHSFGQLVHPRIKALARPRFDAGFFGDAVKTSFKEVNDAVKLIFKHKAGRELGGAKLMTTALSPTDPVIKLSPMVTDSDKNMQQGYMQIFAGTMTGIRNPTAHGNLTRDSRNALHLAILTMYVRLKPPAQALLQVDLWLSTHIGDAKMPAAPNIRCLTKGLLKAAQLMLEEKERLAQEPEKL